MAEILEFPAPALPITRVTETIDISGDVYTIRRTTDLRGNGWLTINDRIGRQILVLSARIPPGSLPHIIGAYRVGRASVVAAERAREQPL